MRDGFQETDIWPQQAAALYGRPGRGGFVLVCEHGSAFIPPGLNDLGVDAATRASHAAWDIGALDVARRLAAHLAAPLVSGAISRLVVDCNRPPEVDSAMPAQSEIYPIPGNATLSPQDRALRIAHVHTPFHDQLGWVLDQAGAGTVLVTIHSFTPVYHGRRRAVELGLLHAQEPDFARAMLAAAAPTGLNCALNAPYGPTDGVMYTLERHGVARGIPHVMVEIRNDLIDTARSADAMADRLLPVLHQAKAALAA